MYSIVIKQLVLAFSCEPLTHGALEFLSYGTLKKLHLPPPAYLYGAC